MEINITVTKTVKSIGEAMKTRRKELSIKQKDLALKTGLSQTYLSQVENDKRGASISVIVNIFHELKMTMQIKYE